MALAILFAFLAGGVILNVIKEEVPAERESRFSAFALGAVGYAGVLLFVLGARKATQESRPGRPRVEPAR